MLISPINPYHTTSELVYSPDRDAELSVWLFEQPKSNLLSHKNSNTKIESKCEEYDPEYLTQNDLVIGMNGQPLSTL